MLSSSEKEISNRQSLEKVVSFRDYVAIGFGSIVGIGWVIVTGDWLNRGGPLGAILAYVIGGLLLISVGKCFAELTSSIPVSGGGFAFAYKAFGSAIGFLTAWFLVFAYLAANAFMTVGFGWLFEMITPSAKTAPLYRISGYPVGLSSLLPGVVIVLIIIYLNYRSVKNSALFQSITTGLMVLCVIVFTFVALVKGSFSNLQPLFSPHPNGLVWAAPVSIIAVLGIVPFFMGGFEFIAQAAEESKKGMNPKNLGKAVIISIITGAIFYAVVLLSLSLCMPWQESVKLEMPMADVFQIAFGYGWLAKLVLITGFLGLITSLNGVFIAVTRLLFAASRGGLLSKWFGSIDEKHHTPKNAILFCGIFALAGPFLGRAALIPLVNVAAFGIVAGWFIVCIGSIKLRHTAPKMHRPYTTKYKITLYIGAVVTGGILLMKIVPGSSAQLQWPLEYLIPVIWIALGFAGYLIRIRRKDISENERAFLILGEYK